MLSVLTAIIGTFARGRAAKAIAGGVGAALYPSGERFVEGLSSGLGDHAFTLGQMTGDGIGGVVVAAVIWLAPKNKDNV